MLTIEFNKQSLNAFYKYLKNLEGDVADYVRAEIEDSMLAIESGAASNVAVDTGALKNSIQSTPIKVSKNQVTGGVEVGASYAPYVEFGTGTRVKVPSELSNFAAQYKGAGVKEVNLPARPFFYPEVFKQRTELPKRIERTLTILMNKKQ
jgi:HK97 gp10 family phage protein